MSLESDETTIATTPGRWFLRGCMIGVLICGSINAASYFFRSDHFGDLLGLYPQHREAIGFPLQVWEKGNSYGGYFADYGGLLVNSLFAIGVGCVCGWVVFAARDQLNAMVKLVEQSMNREPAKFQFTTRGLLLLTGIAAVLAAVGRYVIAGRPEALAVIYGLGPWILIAIALLPRNIAWQQRVVILVFVTIMMMGGAIFVGRSLERSLEFDRVLMGIFVCWTPQTVIAAAGVSATVLVALRRELRGQSVSGP